MERPRLIKRGGLAGGRQPAQVTRQQLREPRSADSTVRGWLKDRESQKRPQAREAFAALFTIRQTS